VTKQLGLSDFRAVRTILEPCDFGLGYDEPDPQPSDPIAKKIWSGIMNLPDDVAVRTSDHNGMALGEAYWLWARWVEAIGDTDDALFVPMLDANDDLQASIFDALHGYYRTAFSALRNVLEVTTIGMCGAFTNSQQYRNWQNGLDEFKFGTACDLLSKEPLLDAFNAGMRAAGHQSLWDAKKGTSSGGYARRLYRDLCNYAHSRRGFTDADLRRSNGPIYVGNVFRDWYYAYLRTTSLCSIVLFLGRARGDRPAFADLFTDDPNVVPPDLLEAVKFVLFA
jgi:hypothetical protein